MPYRNDVFEAGYFYHVYNRGIDGREVFADRFDFRKFLKALDKYLERCEVELQAYCIMSNHFHLMVRQGEKDDMSVFMNRLGSSYARSYNNRHQRTGKVFGGRFKAKLVDRDDYLLQVSKYIHLNPVAAGVVNRPSDYEWSSYRSYIGDLQDPFLNTRVLLDYFNVDNPQIDYREFVEERPFSQSELRGFSDIFLIEDANE